MYADTQPITPMKVQLGTEHISDKVKNQPWGLEAVNWFVKNFLTDGKDLYDLLITPITGDFNRVKVNGDAWSYGRDSFVKLAHNLRENEKKLTSQFWHGEAADAAKTHINDNLAKSFEMAGAMSGFVGVGMSKLSELSLKAGRFVADHLLPKAFDLITRLARKLMPGVGWFSIAWDCVSSGFKFPFQKDVEAIKSIINAIMEMHEKIKQLCNVAKGYATGVNQIIEGLKKIPHIDSTGDALVAGTQIQQGADSIAAQERRKVNKDTGEKEPSKRQQAQTELKDAYGKMENTFHPDPNKEYGEH